MKAVLFGVVAVLLCTITTVPAEVPPGNPLPPAQDKGDGRRSEKGPRDFRDKEGRSMKPEPILMAGDPRFQNMLLLATTPPEKLEEKIKNWPALAEMSDERRDQMKKEMEGFRSRIFKAAMKNAEETGVVLSEEQKPEYVRRYWERRSKVETVIRKDVQDRLKIAMEQENAALKKEFFKPEVAIP